jgi:hypothetical protein
MNRLSLVLFCSSASLAACSAPDITRQQADSVSPEELCQQYGQWSAASMGGEANTGYTESSIRENLEVVRDAIARREIDCTPAASIVTEPSDTQ